MAVNKKFWKLAVFIKLIDLLGGHEEGGWYYDCWRTSKRR